MANPRAGSFQPPLSQAAAVVFRSSRAPRRKRGTATALLSLSLSGLVLAVLGSSLPDQIIYNGSASMPPGFYVRSWGQLEMGAIVTVRARDVSPAYARIRHFTGHSDRFLKRVAAMPGDVVCAAGEIVLVRGRPLMRLTHDSAGRALPTWSGCRALQGEVMLLGDTSDSFDGRYWGPTPIAHIEGVWRRL